MRATMLVLAMLAVAGCWDDGKDGAAGANGTVGIAGPAGPTGATGPAGPRGTPAPSCFTREAVYRVTVSSDIQPGASFVVAPCRLERDILLSGACYGEDMALRGLGEVATAAGDPAAWGCEYTNPSGSTRSVTVQAVCLGAP